MADIFLSYKRTDRDRVAPIVALLEARGWSVWWDTRIDAGEQWDEVIEREVGAARCVVAIWSFESVNSRWVRTEASEGLERGILVPVLIDAAKPPLEFKLVHSIDLTHWKRGAGERPARTLVGAVARLLGQASANTGLPAAAPHERRELIKRLRERRQFAAHLVGRIVATAKAWIEQLASRARRVNGTAVSAALVAALIVAVLPTLWLTGWLGGAPPAPEATGPLRPEVEVVLELAQRRIGNADIMGARRLLGAYESFAPGPIALALGETYDPNMLAAWGTRGVVADADKARSLYRKALRLGAQGAKKRLDNLRLAGGGGAWAGHPPTPLLSAEDRARADRLLEQGTQQLEHGNVAAARLFFQRVYHMGLAAGALRMAETFDAHEVRHLQVLGIKPDHGQARDWYEQARALGHPEAEKRLKRLERLTP